jgi:FkbM family methyltransferase
MYRKIHKFDNGIQVYEDHLINKQRERYKILNIHEAEEEKLFIKLIKSLPKNGSFINIGSAIGYYPILAKKLSPGLSICAIEPLEKFRGFFFENIKLNGLYPEDFIIYQYALSSSRRSATFVNSGYDSHIKRSGWIQVKKTIKQLLAQSTHINPNANKNFLVNVITLDNLIELLGKRVDLVQMDVQGSEFDVLRGGVKSLQNGNILTFLIGTHSRTLHRRCLENLKGNGYFIEFEKYDLVEQPDGIIIASRGIRRLDPSIPTYN